ncbi:unnamed protein product [Urochloa humidicola]
MEIPALPSPFAARSPSRRILSYSVVEDLESRVVVAASDKPAVSCCEELFFVSGDSSRFSSSSTPLRLWEEGRVWQADNRSLLLCSSQKCKEH